MLHPTKRWGTCRRAEKGRNRLNLIRGNDHNFMTASTDQLPSFDSENQIALVLFFFAVLHGHREVSSHVMHISHDSGCQTLSAHGLLSLTSTCSSWKWKHHKCILMVLRAIDLLHHRHLDDLWSNPPSRGLGTRILDTNGMNKEQDKSHTRQNVEIVFEVLKNRREFWSLFLAR